MMALTDWRGAYGLSPNVVKTIFPVSGLFDLEPLRHSGDRKALANASREKIVETLASSQRATPLYPAA